LEARKFAESDDQRPADCPVMRHPAGNAVSLTERLAQLPPDRAGRRAHRLSSQRRRDPAAQIIIASACAPAGDPISLYRQVSRYG
jgi:hypothetical protein